MTDYRPPANEPKERAMKIDPIEAIACAQKALRWLANANIAKEQGDHGRASLFYRHADRWLTKMNAAMGRAS